MLERSELEEIEMALQALSNLIRESAEKIAEGNYGYCFYLGLAYLIEMLADKLSVVEHTIVEAEK